MNLINFNDKLKLFFKSSENMQEIENNNIHLIVTSPPYFNYVDYNNENGIGTEKSYEIYLNNLEKVFRECYRVLCKGGTIAINITNMKSRIKIEKKSFLYPIVSDIIKIMQKIGFIFFDEIIWVKGNANNGALKGKPLFGSYPYPPTPKILDSIFENILIFRKEGKRKSMPKEIKEKSKLSKEEWREYTKGIWFIEPDRKAKHPATFPIEIPKRLIKLYSFVGDNILDPFAGTGTSLIVAYNLNRNSYGYELNPEFKKEFLGKFNEYSQKTLF
jgi:DNA modification methylase